MAALAMRQGRCQLARPHSDTPRLFPLVLNLQCAGQGGVGNRQTPVAADGAPELGFGALVGRERQVDARHVGIPRLDRGGRQTKSIPVLQHG